MRNATGLGRGASRSSSLYARDTDGVEKDGMFNTFSLPVQIYAHIHRACNGRTVKYRA